jgi:hypothetical protein
MKPLTSYVDEHYLKEGYEAPFANPTPPYIRVCAESFSEIWRPIFLDVLTKFQPYASFIEKVRELGALMAILPIIWFSRSEFRGRRLKSGAKIARGGSMSRFAAYTS